MVNVSDERWADEKFLTVIALLDRGGRSGLIEINRFFFSVLKGEVGIL